MKSAAIIASLISRSTPLLNEAELPVVSQDIVDAVNANPAAGWKASVDGAAHKFGQFTVAEARALMGAVRGEVMEHSVNHPDEVLAAVPSSFDPRVSRKACTGPVLDQAFCGSCWAFGAVEAISDRLCMSKNSSTFLQLSPLDMTACNNGFFSGENGCQGGQLGGAWNYAQKTGLVTEKCFPYLKSNGGPVPTCAPEDQPCLPESKFIRTPQCTKKCSDGTDWDSDKHKLSTTYNVPVEQLKAELVNNGPVESAFTVYADFVHYKSGVYSHQTGSMLGGHAIKIIGYGTEDGQDYWLVQNSWTTTWGDGGYFKIKMGGDECGIEGQAVAGSF